MVLFVDHDGALESDHGLAILVVTGGLHGDDADLRTGLRLALLQDLRLGVDGVALEDWAGSRTSSHPRFAKTFWEMSGGRSIPARYSRLGA